MRISDWSSDVFSSDLDRVLAFRNVHNLVMNGQEATANAFSAFYRMLKPGGVLGVVDHRLPEDADAAREKSSGYVKTSTVIKLAEAAGFKMAGKSEEIGRASCRERAGQYV